MTKITLFKKTLMLALAAGTTGTALAQVPDLKPQVQIIHNAPSVSADTVDIYAGVTLLFDSVAFRTATPFFEVEAGPATINITAFGEKDVTKAVLSKTVTFETGGRYIVIANGNVRADSATSDPDSLLNLYVYSVTSTPLRKDSTDLLVFHGAPDAPPINVAAGADTLIDSLSYGMFTDGYLRVKSDNIVLAIVRETDDVTLVAYDVPLATLDLDSLALTVVASGYADTTKNNPNSFFGLLVALPTGGALVPLKSVLNSGPLKADDFAKVVGAAVVYPNPSQTRELRVKYELNEAANVSLSLFDLQGRRISARTSGMQPAGRAMETTYDLNGVAPGTYLLRMEAGRVSRAFRVVVQ